jgi:hypothetical protein
MRDLTKRDIVAAPIGVPKGLAFEIADLILIKGCADFRDLRMVVRLDHGADDEDYEKVVALHATMDRPACSSCGATRIRCFSRLATGGTVLLLRRLKA